MKEEGATLFHFLKTRNVRWPVTFLMYQRLWYLSSGFPMALDAASEEVGIPRTHVLFGCHQRFP